MADAESRVHQLEAQLAQVEQELHDAGGAEDVGAIERLGRRYVETQAELDAAMEAWVQLAEAVAAICHLCAISVLSLRRDETF